MEKEVKRVKMTVAYDGTNYKGWQVQPNGITIEEVLNRHLSSLLGEEIAVTGASRTDSGVHSLGNVAIFDTTTRMPADKISFALNQRLPEDIVVQGSCEVPADWHPRYQNSRKTYEYRILNRTFRMPTRRLDTYFYHHSLDVDYLKAAGRRSIPTEDTYFSQIPDRQSSPEDEYMKTAANTHVEALCMQLKSPYKEVAYAHFCKELSVPEIAQQTGKNPKTVQTQLYRARAMLKKCLKGVIRCILIRSI